MAVVTAGDGVGPDAGCLVGFHTQASISPWRYCVFLSTANHTHRVAAVHNHLAVHFLAADDPALAAIFGSLSGDDGVDKFALCEWHRSPKGPPVLADVAGWMVGPITGRLPAGDHEAFVIEPEVSSLPEPLPPLLRYHEVHSLEPGHEAEG